MIRRNNIAAGATTFGQRFGNIANTEKTARPDAEVWLNIGYETGDETYPVVTLPFGIPIDTQAPLKLNGRDQGFLAFTGARNQLLEDIQAAAESLAPGEDMIIGGLDGGLVLQLRRRNSTAEQPAPENNPLMRKFEFVSKAA